MPIIAEEFIPRIFLPQLTALRDAIFVRVLPAFEWLESEAEQIQLETLEQLNANANEAEINLITTAFECPLFLAPASKPVRLLRFALGSTKRRRVMWASLGKKTRLRERMLQVCLCLESGLYFDNHRVPDRSRQETYLAPETQRGFPK